MPCRSTPFAVLRPGPNELRVFLGDALEHLAALPAASVSVLVTSPPYNLGVRYLKPALRAAGLPEDLRYYDLRHTAATLMIASGANIKVVQRQMGHRTASLTLDVYGHLLPEDLDAVADRLDQTRATALEAVAAAGAGKWPQGGPAVVPLNRSAGQ